LDITDKYACAEVIQAWGLARDQGRWDDLAATFHPGGQIHVSWFRGAFPDFIERCRQNHGKGIRSKHVLWPAFVRVRDTRATSEVSVAILVRQTIAGIEVDLTSHARFLDRLERRDEQWRMVERATVYEHDRLDPVEPSPQFAELMAAGAAAGFPAPYRYMGFRVVAAGRALAEPVHYDGRAETEVLKVRYADWLNGK
jgi:hypothetical protein